MSMMGKFFTFYGTGGTDFSAQLHQGSGKPGVPGTELDTKNANFCTITAKQNTVQVILIIHFDTIGGTDFTGTKTGKAGFNCQFKLFHNPPTLKLFKSFTYWLL
jgi:hypothetical protein